MYEMLYTKKENAVQRVRELYLNGSSLIEIRDCIKSESLIEYQATSGLGLFMIECFCLNTGNLKLILNLFSISPSSNNDYEDLLNDWSQMVKNLIETNKPKWNVIEKSDT